MDKPIIEMDIADAIMERPHCFTFNGMRYFLYPITLGKSYLLARYVATLGVSNSLLAKQPFLEALRLVRKHHDIVARIVAVSSIRDKDTLFDEHAVSQRAEVFKDLTDEDMAQLLMLILTHDNISAYKKHLGLDKEAERMKKAIAAKKDGGTYTFGGVSVYGTLIDKACERYGWTVEYVVWGVSLTNLQLMLEDAITSVYLTKDEKQRAHVPQRSGGKLAADDPNASATLARLFKGSKDVAFKPRTRRRE